MAYYQEFDECNLCARRCLVNRNHNGLGFCGMSNHSSVSLSMLHYWEEPCLAGENGSGAIFFTGCSIGCVYCQNHRISGVDRSSCPIPSADYSVGKASLCDATELAALMLNLQAQGADNIDLVTPTHFIPIIIDAVSLARTQGLSLPIVYNTGTYETCESVAKLKGFVDIFMPDLKYYDPAVSERYSFAPDYFTVASAAIAKMYELTGPAVFDSNGRLLSGVLVRHLVLPGHTKDSRAILRYLHSTYGDDILISIMRQYTPMPWINQDYPELSRRITDREYNKVVDYALDLGISNAYIQERGTATESFIPDF